MQWPSVQHQMIAASASPALTRYWLSAENATACTQPLCPVRTKMHWPLWGFHSRIVLSHEPDACQIINKKCTFRLFQLSHARKHVNSCGNYNSVQKHAYTIIFYKQSTVKTIKTAIKWLFAKWHFCYVSSVTAAAGVTVQLETRYIGGL